MARYIDVDKLLNNLPNDLPYKASVKRVIMQAPTADVAEVVRCKSCVHYQNGACNHFGYYTYAPDVDEDDFCSYGERSDT
jgi:hypothetical protein